MDQENLLPKPPDQLRVEVEFARQIAQRLVKRLKDLSSDPRRRQLSPVCGPQTSYVRKLVTELSGGVFGYLDSVLERHSFDEFGELI